MTHARENVRLYRAFLGRKSGQVMQRRFRETVARLVAGELAHLGVAPDDVPMAAQFLTGGFAEMLLTWLDKPARIDADALAARFRAYALGLVRTHA